MTPEELGRDLELFGALKPYADRDRNCTVGELRALCEDVKAAALAYARLIVTEECARVVELWIAGSLYTCEPVLSGLAAVIREHGKGK